jgi:hypothetical protein
MATIAKIETPEQALEYAGQLTLDSEGLPPLNESATLISKLVQFSTQVGKDIFTLDRFVRWNDKVRSQAVQAAAGQNQFSAVKCPVSEEEFIKYAPDQIACIFFNSDQLARMEKLLPGFPAGFGQILRCKKKAGEAQLNPKTGTKSGGRYKGGKYGYWYGGVVTQTVKLPNGKTEVIKGRPSINMVLEGIQLREDFKGTPAAGPMTGDGDEDEIDSELETTTVTAGEGVKDKA